MERRLAATRQRVRAEEEEEACSVRRTGASGDERGTIFLCVLVCLAESVRVPSSPTAPPSVREVCVHVDNLIFSLTVPTSIATHMYIHCSLLRAHAAQNKKKMRLGSSR